MTIDIYYAIREFYLLEGLYAEALGRLTPFLPSHEKWKEDFLAYREEYINKLARAIYDYTTLTTSSEMRWAREEASFYYKNWYNSKSYDREEVYVGAIRYNDTFLLKAAEKIFGMAKWTKWYGGAKWWKIAKVGLMYHTISPVIFIDYCVDLTHNGSIFFNKDAGIFFFWGEKEYKSMLDEKREHSFEDFLYFDYNSLRITKFTKRLNNITGAKFPVFRYKRKNLAEQAVNDVLSYSPINWGKETFETVQLKNFSFDSI